LKKKQRILVPDSCILIGVIDEAGHLKAGEVFVQIQRGSYRSKPNLSYQVQKKLLTAEKN
jgi:hypothetical protein